MIRDTILKGSSNDCSDNNHNLTEEVILASGNRYYLIVPRTAHVEGSYGHASNGTDRARGTTTCVPLQNPTCPMLEGERINRQIQGK